MSAKELVFGAAVKMFKGEPHRVLKHNKAAQAFQDSLQINESELGRERVCKTNKSKKSYKLTDEEKQVKAEKAREAYKSITREEMDRRNETGRKGRENRRA
jgi:hypothetical protein